MGWFLDLGSEHFGLGRGSKWGGVWGVKHIVKWFLNLFWRHSAWGYVKATLKAIGGASEKVRRGLIKPLPQYCLLIFFLLDRPNKNLFYISCWFMMSGIRFNQTFQKFWHFHRFQIELEMNKSLLKLSVGFKKKPWAILSILAADMRLKYLLLFTLRNW